MVTPSSEHHPGETDGLGLVPAEKQASGTLGGGEAPEGHW